jgi:hypothetical protein
MFKKVKMTELMREKNVLKRLNEQKVKADAVWPKICGAYIGFNQ